MSREWKPGDVAMVTTVHGWSGVMLRREDGETWFNFDGMWNQREIAAARPLVVIDPEDAEQVERLVERMARAKVWAVIPESIEALHAYRAEQMQAALREFADPKPRIEEPRGLGAVVRGSDGEVWVRRSNECRPVWVNAVGGTFPTSWDNIDAAEVLSEGVTS